LGDADRQAAVQWDGKKGVYVPGGWPRVSSQAAKGLARRDFLAAAGKRTQVVQIATTESDGCF